LTDITITAGTTLTDAVTLLNTEVPPAPVDLTSVLEIEWVAGSEGKIVLRKRQTDGSIDIINETGSGGGVNTTLTGSADSKQPDIIVDSTSGFVLGGTVYILDTVSNIGESLVITTIESGTSMTMSTDLVNAYPLVDTTTVTQIALPQFLITFNVDDTSPAFGIGSNTEQRTYSYELRIYFGDGTQEVVLTGDFIIEPSESASTDATTYIDSIVWGIY
jgi:hypothetical protein